MKCRDCGKTYEDTVPTSWCKECCDKFNTPEVIKAREEYQKTEAFSKGCRNIDGLIVPNDRFVEITPYHVKFKTREDIQKDIKHINEEIQEATLELSRLVKKKRELEDKIRADS